MSTGDTCRQVRDTIAALRDDRYDAITAEKMAAAESHLNECELCRGALAEVRAEPRTPLSDVVEMPTPQTWHRVWDVIDHGAKPAKIAPLRILRFARPWSTFAAAAVVMLMIGLWRVIPGDDWEFRLAGPNDVEIELLEVFGDSTSMIMSAGGDDDEISIIWVMDDEGA